MMEMDEKMKIVRSWNLRGMSYVFDLGFIEGRANENKGFFFDEFFPPY